MTRPAAHTRPSPSAISTSHTHVVRPRCRRVGIARFGEAQYLLSELSRHTILAPDETELRQLQQRLHLLRIFAKLLTQLSCTNQDWFAFRTCRIQNIERPA